MKGRDNPVLRRSIEPSKFRSHSVSGTYNDKTKQKSIWVGSFHPTPDGQQSGYEAAFSAAGL